MFLKTMSTSRSRVWLLVLALAIVPVAGATGAASNLRFKVTLPGAAAGQALQGRMLVVLSKDIDGKREPRFEVNALSPLDSQQVFGMDVQGLQPGGSVLVGGDAVGYPVVDVAAIPPGTYRVQALLNRYDTYHLGDGKTVELPPDRGEGQHWNSKPGNLYSEPTVVRIEEGKPQTIDLALTKTIAPLPPVPDTEYVKHVKYKSPELSKFWGRDTYVDATILLPEGWSTHPKAHYPVVVYQGHFSREFAASTDFRASPPDANLPPVNMEMLRKYCPDGHDPILCRKYGYERLVQQYSHEFYKTWKGPDFPRVILVTIQHPTPYFDDSYAVNSANLGPYGDAITYGLIPYIEKKYRGIGQGWARAQMGGSTGGWETLADQIFYPTEYNGAYASCPDPIDFRAYSTVDIYADDNAYYKYGAWPEAKVARPFERDFLDRVKGTVQQANALERALGSHARSGEQWDIWQAVFGPQGEDGYPVPIWNKETGRIDHKVAEYWKQNYDLRAYLERNWSRIGPDLVGKLHIYVGLSDTFYLTNAVYYMEQFLKGTKDPYYGGTVDYGKFAGHCWSGDHEHMNFVSRLTYAQRFIPMMATHWLETAPKGADTTSWRY